MLDVYDEDTMIYKSYMDYLSYNVYHGGMVSYMGGKVTPYMDSKADMTDVADTVAVMLDPIPLVDPIPHVTLLTKHPKGMIAKMRRKVKTLRFRGLR